MIITRLYRPEISRLCEELTTALRAYKTLTEYTAFAEYLLYIYIYTYIRIIITLAGKRNKLSGRQAHLLEEKCRSGPEISLAPREGNPLDFHPRGIRG